MQTTVRLKELENRWEITLMPPKGKPPTLGFDVMSELRSALDTITEALSKSKNGPCRLLVVQSASERSFCVGANIGVQILNDAERAARDGSALAESAYSRDCITSPDTEWRIRNFLNKGKN